MQRIASGSASSVPRDDRDERDACENDGEQHERHGAGCEDEHREGRERAEPPRLQGPERKERERHPERERECAGEDDARPDDGKRADRPARVGAPFACRDDAERECRRRDADDREQLDPDQRRERVVEQAVGDEAVAPGVPEVVPDPEALILEDLALVEVRGEIAAGRPVPGESRGKGRRDARCGQGLSRNRSVGVSERCHARPILVQLVAALGSASPARAAVRPPRRRRIRP